ncbi:hypothetical protein CC85DRAFT_287896 [Cutaneotrichosporon oleaginosum]|uniref:Manganese/iron superoxide dismutase C-terminal domain-containing protein n=1 Tax=Cutaneotrichosporon oleaginosum TaxID=879819 RepID=A0A0J0XG21_9TREE|nr:uncharacterized protein CC85DRAFT_287896 [Cutaneotrichosporon oleaginosum]KLT40015.1 hypothetical protein CC85DRAFT_287896 [Cutaneotrichosporon oleaginosum]TXT13843.1 hypothetical protein COLE_00036 [Cutaneotrichosporon oleaginosum]
MSRPLANFARAAARSPLAPFVSSAPARSILTAAAAGSTRKPTGGAIGGVDPRILNGLPSFIGAEQFDRLNEWQAGLWERLQGEVRNNPGLSPIKLKWDNDKLHMTDLLALSAREPSLALAFNYASLLLNNSYFLEGLNADAAKPVPDHFQALEDRVAAYADGIVGSGWLWIVKAGDGLADIDVVPTYGAGTLLVTMRQQRGRQDTLPVFGTPATSGDLSPAPAPEAESSPDAPPPRQNPSAAGRRAGSEATPLAVLNLFEHAYLGDKYGVFSRGQYARDWFRTLDWDKVSKRTASAGTW